MAVAENEDGVDTRRRGFLRGRFSSVAAPPPLRPPWAAGEEDFLRLCTRCGDCIRACPTKILVGAPDKEPALPRIDFSRGECTFCGDCRNACPSGALQRPPAGGHDGHDGRRSDASGAGEAPRPWTLRAEIGVSCLGHHRVECRVCEDQCGRAAIRIRPRIGGPGIPEIDHARCNGCGACVAPCPVGAVGVRPA